MREPILSFQCPSHLNHPPMTGYYEDTTTGEREAILHLAQRRIMKTNSIRWFAAVAFVSLAALLFVMAEYKPKGRISAHLLCDGAEWTVIVTNGTRDAHYFRAWTEAMTNGTWWFNHAAHLGQSDLHKLRPRQTLSIKFLLSAGTNEERIRLDCVPVSAPWIDWMKPLAGVDKTLSYQIYLPPDNGSATQH